MRLVRAHLNGAAVGFHGVVHDAQAQAAAPRLAGAGLVDAVEAPEDVVALVLRDADAGVRHGQLYAAVRGVEGGGDAALGEVVLHGVFQEIEDNMVHVVLGGQHDAAVVEIAVQGNLLFRRHGAQQGHRVEHGLLHVHRLRHDFDVVVHARQAQQILGHVLEALGLVADIGDEFPHGLHVHVLGLHDAVREEADGGQRRFQLMRGVGDEAAALPLGILQIGGQGVEFPPQLGQLVLALYLHAVFVVAAGDDADGVGELLELAQHRRAVERRHHQSRQGDDDGQHPDLQLQLPQDLAALGVVFPQEDRAGDIARACDGDGVAGQEAPVPKDGAEHRLALQGRKQVGLHLLAAGAVGVVNRVAVHICDGDTLKALHVQQAQHLRHVLLVRLLQPRQGRGQRGGLALHGLLLLLIDRVAGGDVGEDVEHHKQHRQQHGDKREELKADAAGVDNFLRPGGGSAFIRQGNIPLPTW